MDVPILMPELVGQSDTPLTTAADMWAIGTLNFYKRGIHGMRILISFYGQSYIFVHVISYVRPDWY
jgi:hypothetical protein